MKSSTKLLVVLAVMLLATQMSAWASDWEEPAWLFTNWWGVAGDVNLGQYPFGSCPFAIDSDGNLHTVFARLHIDPVDFDIVWREYDAGAWSFDDGWQIPVVEEENISTSEFCASTPSVVIDSNGMIHAVWSLSDVTYGIRH
ncbi:MAG TPA: hypothetical protein VFI02_11200, partial [Armatimonadota bacterium]|nr:hypothetical protein [Armatimonadota bacterium]